MSNKFNHRFYEKLTERYPGILDENALSKISEIVVCCAGTGGSTAWSALAFARLGVKEIRVADPETYDISNMNRQPGARIDTIGKNKCEIIADDIRNLNPKINVISFDEGISDENLNKFLSGGTIVLDGIDLYEMEIKSKMFMAAREKNMPVFSCPILGWGSALLIFHPIKSPSFIEMFGEVPEKNCIEWYRYIEDYAKVFFWFLPKLPWKLYRKRTAEGKVPSVGTSVMFAGLLIVNAAIDYILETGNFPTAPNGLHIDLMQLKIVKGGRLRRLFIKLFMNLIIKLPKNRFDIKTISNPP